MKNAQRTTRQSPSKFARNATLATALVLGALWTDSAGATVIEFSGDGIANTRSKTHTPTAEPQGTKQLTRHQHPKSANNQFRQLSQKIGLAYSDAAGVKAAKLDALTFVDVFEALVERESAFNPDAVSPKGAQGLGQLMPGTAADMGVSDPFDPEANLIGSAKYLTQLLSEFGSIELALAAYNAGPGRVRQYGGIPPFPETRAYVDWIFKTAGLSRDEPTTVKASARAQSVDGQTLNGDVSVWEF